jgi:enterochelin esterase-like enzyme
MFVVPQDAADAADAVGAVTPDTNAVETRATPARTAVAARRDGPTHPLRPGKHHRWIRMLVSSEMPALPGTLYGRLRTRLISRRSLTGAGPRVKIAVRQGWITNLGAMNVRQVPESWRGELVTETLDYDGGRQVTVYVPPDPPQAVVFAGDGQLISQWGGVLEEAEVPPTMIVGVHRLADETLRLHEYSPGFQPERFAAHETFFVEDVRRWARSRLGLTLPTERTAVLGVSAGGELALALGLRHPDVYGAIFCASPGAGYRPPDVMPGTIPRAYLVAGTLEPFFLANATRWAAALRDAGVDVEMRERVASHDAVMWRAELPLMVAWAFGRRVPAG